MLKARLYFNDRGHGDFFAELAENVPYILKREGFVSSVRLVDMSDPSKTKIVPASNREISGISRKHASFCLGSKGLTLSDLDSTYGTYLIGDGKKYIVDSNGVGLYPGAHRVLAGNLLFDLVISENSERQRKLGNLINRLVF